MKTIKLDPDSRIHKISMLFSGDSFKGIMLQDDKKVALAESIWNTLGVWKHSKLPYGHEIIGFEAQASECYIKSLNFITWKPYSGWQFRKT